MKKPYILAIDDDVSVLRAVERDLKAKFSPSFRVLGVDSPQKALGTVRQLTSRGDRIALFLVDQRMPHMSGTEFLAEAIPRLLEMLDRKQLDRSQAFVAAYAPISYPFLSWRVKNVGRVPSACR